VLTVGPRWATKRGSREYDSWVIGSATKQWMTAVFRFMNGSMYTVFGSAISTMSDSWICWNPRTDDPSKPCPSVK